MNHAFTLIDDHGIAHNYVCAEHDYLRGRAITRKLLAAAGPAVGRLAGGAFGSLGAAFMSGKKVKDLLNEDLGAMIGDIDFAAVGADIGQIVSILDDRTVDELLANVVRDGKGLAQAVEAEAAFRRNYGELVLLLVEIIRYNGFFPIAPISRLLESGKKKEPTSQSQQSSPAPRA